MAHKRAENVAELKESIIVLDCNIHNVIQVQGHNWMNLIKI